MNSEEKGITTEVTTVLDVMGMPFELGAQFGPKTDTIFKARLGDLSLGKIIEYLVDLAEPGRDFKLPPPWNILNDINLRNFVFMVDITNNCVGFQYSPLGIDLTFLKLNKIEIWLALKPRKTLKIGVYGSFIAKDFSRTPLSWDMLNERPPEVPSKGAKILDLRYVGLGQHVTLRDIQNLTDMKSVMAALEESYKDIDKYDNPLDKLDALKFDASSNWLVGMDFTILQTVSLAIIFNDPNMYGLRLGLQGERAKSLAGLEFEILYRRISDNVGVYHFELKLPDALRTFEVGTAAVTLPVVALDIYTNGNFKVDIGFPYNLDFSRAAGLQVIIMAGPVPIPVIGAAGFYFAILNGETSTDVPRITNGEFSPVIAAGFGIQLGLGKTINKGIFSAGLVVAFEGVLEGVVGFFHPYQPDVKKENFFKFSGTIGVVGHVYGSVSFAIAQARVDFYVHSSAQLIYECHMPAVINLEAGVRVALQVKVGVGIFKVSIKLSYNAKIYESFKIGSKTPTPWIVESNQNRALAQDRSRLSRPESFALSSRILFPPRVDQTGAADDLEMSRTFRAAFNAEAKQTIDLYFYPQVTVGLKDDHPGRNGQNGAHELQTQLTAVLFVLRKDFQKLFEQILTWQLGREIIDPQNVTVEIFEKHFEDITRAGYELTFCTTINEFLDERLAFDLKAPPADAADGESGWDPDVVIFPVLKDIGLKTSDGVYEVDFSRPDLCVDERYIKFLAEYFEQTLPKTGEAPGAEIPPQRSAGAAEKIPLAQYLTADYFLTILRQAMQDAIDIYTNYEYSADDHPQKSLQEITAEFGLEAGDALHDIALANQNSKSFFAVESGGESSITINKLSIEIQPGDSLESIAGRLQVMPVNLVTEIKDQQDILQNGAKLKISGGFYVFRADDTLESVAGKFYIEEPNDLRESNTQIDWPKPEDEKKLDAFSKAYGTTIFLPDVDYTVKAGDTLQIIADFFGVSVQSLADIEENIASTKLLVNDIEKNNVKINIGLKERLKSGESLVDLAGRLSRNCDPIDAADLAYRNKDQIGLLRAGESLEIEGVLYVLCRGDTFQSIAERFSISTTDLISNSREYDKAKKFDEEMAFDWSPPPGSGAALRWGRTLHLRKISYTVKADDTLQKIADFCGLDVRSICNHPDILQKSQKVQNLALISLPPITYWISSETTLAGIAAQFDISVEQLLLNQWSGGVSLNTIILPRVKKLPLKSITAILSRQKAFDNAAAMVSRFLLQGLRIPDTQTAVSRLEEIGLSKVELFPLYTMTGQQWPAPAAGIEEYGISLTVKGDEANKIDVRLEQDSLDLIKQYEALFIKDPPIDPGIISVDRIAPYSIVPKRFGLGPPDGWLTAAPPQFVDTPDLSAGTPRLYPIPKLLQVQLQNAGSQLIQDLELMVGHFASPGLKPDPPSPVSNFGWTTRLDFGIRRVPDTENPREFIPNTYELFSTDEEGRHLLRDLIRYLNNSADSPPTVSIDILYNSNPTAADSQDLRSDDIKPAEIILLKTNLSTEPKSPAQPKTRAFAMAQPGPEEVLVSAAMDDARNFLKLLLEGSVVNTGGYYLFYQTADSQKSGLPPYLFNETPIANLTILVTLYSKENACIRAQSFHNSVICCQNLTSASADLFVQAPVVAAKPGDSLKQLADARRVDVQVLARANATVLNIFQVGSKIEAFGDYTVTLNKTLLDIVSESGNSLEDVISAVSELPILTPGVELIIDKPVLISVTSGDTKLRQIAESNDIDPQALARANASVKNLLQRGSSIEALEGYEVAADDNLIGISRSTGKSLNRVIEAVADLDILTPGTILQFNGAWTVRRANITPGSVGFRLARRDPAPLYAVKMDESLSVIADNLKVDPLALGEINAEACDLLNIDAEIPDLDGYRITGGDSLQKIAAKTKKTFREVIEAVVGRKDIFRDGAEIQVRSVSIEERLQTLYNLVACRLEANGAFHGSGHGVPVGPAKEILDDREVHDLPWDYRQVLWTADFADSDAGLPESNGRNPYAGVGKTARVSYQYHDIFGNKCLPESALGSVEIPVLYRDPLQGLDQWSGLLPGYDIQGAGTDPEIVFQLDMDVARYVPAPGSSFDLARQNAEADLIRCRQIYYQISQPDIHFNLTTTLNSEAERPVLDKKGIMDLLLNFENYLSTVVDLNQVTYPPAEDKLASKNLKLEDIAEKYGITSTLLAEANKDDANFLADSQDIIIPRIHLVIRGDTLDIIVEQSQTAGLEDGLSTDLLIEKNPSLPLNPGVEIRTGFILTDESFKKLKSDGMSETSIASLEDMKNREFTGENEFIAALKTALDEKYLNLYKSLIFDSSQQLYTIAEGDTFSRISGALECPLKTIADLNSALPNIFTEGCQVLLGVSRHRIDASDSLASLAYNNGLSASILARTNETLPIINQPVKKDGREDRLVIPNHLTLGANISATRKISVGETLSSIAGAAEILPLTIATANQSIEGILQKDCPINWLNQKEKAKGNDTLLSIFMRIRNRVPEYYEITGELLEKLKAFDIDAALIGKLEKLEVKCYPEEPAFRNKLGTVIGSRLTPEQLKTILSDAHRVTVYEDFIKHVGEDSLLLAAGADLVIPPPGIKESIIITPSYPAVYFPLNVSVTISRSDWLVDPAFLAVDGVARVVSTLKPNTFAEPETGDRNRNGNKAGLREFAKRVEDAFPGIKLATGVGTGRENPETANTMDSIIAIQYNEKELPYEIIDRPSFFALKPLTTSLWSAKDLEVRSYENGKLSDKPLKKNFHGNELDAWAYEFLKTVDHILSPEYSVVAERLGGMPKAALESIVRNKEKLAEGISRNIGRILKSDDNSGIDWDAVRDKLKQRLRVQLGEAYKSEVIVQYPVKIKSPYTESHSTTRLFGQAQHAGFILDETDTLQSLAEKFSAPLDLLVATIIDCKLILNTGCIIKQENNEFEIKQGDTLGHLLERLIDKTEMKLEEQAQAIKDTSIFKAGAGLNLINRKYKIQPGDIFQRVIENLSSFSMPEEPTDSQKAIIENFISMNRGVKNIFHSEIKPLEYRTKKDDTLVSVAKALDMDCFDLVDELFVARDILNEVEVSYLYMLPGFSLSDAKLTLTGGSVESPEESYLTFVFESHSGDHFRSVPLEPEYQVNEFEYNIKDIEFARGYQSSDWLSFIRLVKNAPISPSVVIPMPLRTYPAPPVLKNQNALFKDRNNQEPAIADIKEYTYRFDFDYKTCAQDQLYLGYDCSAKASIDQINGANDSTLAHKLAQYSEIADDLNQDLAVLPALKVGAPNEKVENALQTFADQVAEITAAWLDWTETETVSEDRRAFAMAPKPTAEVKEYRVIHHKTRRGVRKMALIEADHGMGSGAEMWYAGEIKTPPDIRLKGHMPVDTPRDIAMPEYGFQKSRKFGLSAPGRGDLSQEYTFPPLNILENQSITGFVSVKRNEHLLADSETDAAFIYTVPAVKFLSPLRPYNKYEGRIDVNQFPSDPAGDNPSEGGTDNPQVTKLTAKLSNMFREILKIRNETYYEGSLRVTAGFGFELTGSEAGLSDHNIITVLPVLLCPMFSFDSKRDLKQDSGFCRSLAERLTAWYEAEMPSPAQALWLFNVVVYSNIQAEAGMEEPPLIEFTNLQLKLSDYQD